MDFAFTKEQEAFREMLRDFIKRECPPDLDRRLDDEGRYPFELTEKVVDTGLLGLPFPEVYGGSGGGPMEFVIAAEETAYGSAAVAAIFILPAFFAGEMLYMNGSEEQKRTWLPKVARGEVRGCFGLTEPNAGSDAVHIETRATQDGDGFVINGQKTMISGVDVATHMMLATNTSPGGDYSGMTLFMVPTSAAGFTHRRMGKIGSEIIGLFEVFFDNVHVSQENIIGGPEMLNQGWLQLMKQLDMERIMIAAQYTGLAARATDDAVEYAKERKQFGKTIGSYQMIQSLLADMTVGTQTSRLMTYYAAWLKANDMPCNLAASQAKIYATETARTVCLNGMQVMGGYGYLREFDMQRLVRDSLLGPIGGGTNQIQRLIIARELGLI
ncbi:MAG: acyl-CoA dehydrogenase family protein [Actinomycetota bacterium]|nr:acyl-CoA dehydrogenase family protein [Actinomycetota bacterium]